MDFDSVTRHIYPEGKTMVRKSGFTLIELMVVILIIALLATMVLSISSSVMNKAKGANTQATIQSLVNACGQYQSIFGVYPNLDATRPGYPGAKKDALPLAGNKITDKEYKEYNRRLRSYLQDKGYIVDKIFKDQALASQLPMGEDDKDYNDNAEHQDNLLLYRDAWDNFLRVCMARDHRLDVPVGANLYLQNFRNYYPPDIFSLGPNEQNEVDNGPSGASTAITTYGYNSNNDGIDDIVSWTISTNR